MKRLDFVMVGVLCAGIVCSIMGFASYGCSGAQQTAAKAALVCAESAVAKDIVPTAETILITGASSWEAQLSALALAFGSDAVACAVQLAKADFAAKPGAATSETATQRADQYLHDHGG